MKKYTRTHTHTQNTSFFAVQENELVKIEGKVGIWLNECGKSVCEGKNASNKTVTTTNVVNETTVNDCLCER